MVKVAPLHRVYDAKFPLKERSQTVSSLRNIHGGSAKSLQYESKERLRLKKNQPATSRESRQHRGNLPPAPNNSSRSQKARKSNSVDEEDENEAASEPDIKTDRARKNWSGRQNSKPVKQVKSENKTNKACKFLSY
jgi:hypothetical protein